MTANHLCHTFPPTYLSDIPFPRRLNPVIVPYTTCNPSHDNDGAETTT